MGIYAFGLVLYEIITGVTPFIGMTKEEFFAKVIFGNKRPGLDYDEFGREIKTKDSIRELILSCWDVDPVKRPSADHIFSLLYQLESIKISVRDKKRII